MSRYMEQAKDLGEQVKEFMIMHCSTEGDDPEVAKNVRNLMARDLGYLLSKAIQCHTRPLQTTVRKNIIEAAVGEYCNVTVKEETLPATAQYPTPKTIKKVIITPKVS